MAGQLHLGGMVPPLAARPDVLPTERLDATGRPRPALRAGLRRLENARNVANLAGAWVQSFGMLVAASWATARLTAPAAVAVWLAAFVLAGRGFALLAVLGHEAAHRLLFSSRRANDLAGRWLLAYPAFVPFEAYRRSHFSHHRDELGPDEPDLVFYAGYPMPWPSLRRKLVRDALGVSGWKNLRGLARAARRPPARGVVARIALAQLAVWAALWAATGRWWLYPCFWFAPWMTVWRVLNRLRAVAEHGGMAHDADRRATTHVVRQTWPARFWIVPYRTGWHLAHHVDMGVPFQHLPALHRELVAAGWVTPALEHRSYLALWRACVEPAES